MKMILSLVLTLILVSSLSACGKEENKSTIMSDGSNKQTTDISSTDISSTDISNPNFSNYVGMWSEDDISYEMGGLILEISLENKKMQIYCSLTQSAPSSRVAEFTENINLSDIKNNTANFSYSDDGWGNSGKLELIFNDGYIFADFKDIVSDNLAQWGFYEDTYKLFKNEKAQDIIMQGSNEYYEDILDITTPSAPVYDTSKASGILAQIGMTEQEFRDNCTPLYGFHYIGKYNAWKHKSLVELGRYDFAYGKQYFDNNPNDSEMLEEKNKWEKICKEYPKWKNNYDGLHTWYEYRNGNNRIHFYEKYQTLETYLNEQLYARIGYRKICEDTEKLFKQIKEYPNNYVGQSFVLLDAPSTLYDENFAGLPISIHDLRDDTHNPNIISEYDYYFYVIFTGTHTGYDGLVLDFNLISLEKISE